MCRRLHHAGLSSTVIKRFLNHQPVLLILVEKLPSYQLDYSRKHSLDSFWALSHMALSYFLVALSLLCLTAADGNFGSWQTGRATHYGTDAWSIHKGSCGYGWLDQNVATGWDVAAISDKASDYGGSCGKCKEVRCNPTSFSDGYGQWLDRQKSCYNNYASVVVMVTDTCPCIYPDNYASNKRWCCGDMYHLDLSVWAYEKLAAKYWGVIGVQWRDVPCWYRPKNVAKVPFWTKPTPKPWWEKAPSNWVKSMDRRAQAPTYQSGRRL